MQIIRQDVHRSSRSGLAVKSRAALLTLALALVGCGTTQVARNAADAVHHGGPKSPQLIAGVQGKPQAVQPAAGVQSPTASTQGSTGSAETQWFTPSDPVGDPNAHAPPLSQVRRELKLELVAVRKTNAAYIDPLRYVTVWERTDQGVDANMPIGAPILAPCEVKILDIEPDWYLTQPLIYFELLVGPQAGKVQYVAEEITDLARPGEILQQGQVIARYAPSGTGIEYGWSTPSGITLAVATTGYEEGEMTPAGMWMRDWLNSLGAHAGPNHP